MKAMPKISKYMTTSPHTIGEDISLKKAHDMMQQHRIRHLPVQMGGKLVGIITDRDVKLASSFQGAAEFKVDDVMSPDPYTVSSDTPLNDVVAEMAEHKYGCAIILDNSKVVGIFTAVDAMRVFAEHLNQTHK